MPFQLTHGIQPQDSTFGEMASLSEIACAQPLRTSYPLDIREKPKKTYSVTGSENIMNDPCLRQIQSYTSRLETDQKHSDMDVIH